jgi:hypothetical protein
MPFLRDHDITAHDLATYGSSPKKVCDELTLKVGKSIVYSVAPDRHRELLRELYQAAFGIESPITVADAEDAFLAILSRRGMNQSTEAEMLLAHAYELACYSLPRMRGGAFEIPFLQAVEANCILMSGG